MKNSRHYFWKHKVHFDGFSLKKKSSSERVEREKKKENKKEKLVQALAQK